MKQVARCMAPLHDDYVLQLCSSYLALAAAMESSPPMTSPPPGSLVISGDASLAASLLAAFCSNLASLATQCYQSALKPHHLNEALHSPST